MYDVTLMSGVQKVVSVQCFIHCAVVAAVTAMVTATSASLVWCDRRVLLPPLFATGNQRKAMPHRTANSSQTSVHSAATPPPSVRVWDIFVRVFHWALVISFVIAWLTEDDFEALHEWAGYAAGALVLLRLIWGLIGTRYARFTQFVKGPEKTLEYVGEMVRGSEARYVGHNPAGGAMVIALLLGMLAVSVSGWMLTLDQFSRADWVEEGHEIMASGLLGLVLLHIAGVFLAGMRHRENLVRAMFTGRKRAAGDRDID